MRIKKEKNDEQPTSEDWPSTDNVGDTLKAEPNALVDEDEVEEEESRYALRASEDRPGFYTPMQDGVEMNLEGFLQLLDGTYIFLFNIHTTPNIKL